MVHNKIIKHLEIALKRAEEEEKNDEEERFFLSIEYCLKTLEVWFHLLGNIKHLLGEEIEEVEDSETKKDIETVIEHLKDMLKKVGSLKKTLSKLNDKEYGDKLKREFEKHMSEFKQYLKSLDKSDEKIKNKLGEAFEKAKKKLIDDKKKGVMTSEDSFLHDFLIEVMEIEGEL